MKWLLIALCPVALPVHAAAERPVSPAEFEAIVTGKTYTYSVEGTPYGAEEYLDNRRVKWTFLDGECQDGEWYVSGEQICFVYEHIETHQCWMFFMDGNRMMARYAGDPAATTLYETAQSDEPLMCLGPKIGV